MEAVKYVCMGETRLNAKIAKAVKYVNMAGTSIDAEIARAVKYVSMAGTSIIAEIARAIKYVSMTSESKIAKFARVLQPVLPLQMLLLSLLPNSRDFPRPTKMSQVQQPSWLRVLLNKKRALL